MPPGRPRLPRSGPRRHPADLRYAHRLRSAPHRPGLPLAPYLIFTPRRIRALRPGVETLTTALLDEAARCGPPADLIEALAVPLPVLVICELLGVPHADRARSERGLTELFGYGQQLVARKRAQPAMTSSPGCVPPKGLATTRSPYCRCSCCSPWRKYCGLRPGRRRHPPLRPYRPAGRRRHGPVRRPGAAGQRCGQSRPHRIH